MQWIKDEERGLSDNLGLDLTDARGRLGFAIRMQRLKLSLTQEELADLVRIHVTYLSQIEQGKRRPSSLLLKRLESHLNIRLSLTES